ncbi:hypothetical protein HaLaN_26773, partial [Haematococcus lacustris]
PRRQFPLRYTADSPSKGRPIAVNNSGQADPPQGQAWLAEGSPAAHFLGIPDPPQGHRCHTFLGIPDPDTDTGDLDTSLAHLALDKNKKATKHLKPSQRKAVEDALKIMRRYLTDLQPFLKQLLGRPEVAWCVSQVRDA